MTSPDDFSRFAATHLHTRPGCGWVCRVVAPVVAVAMVALFLMIGGGA